MTSNESRSADFKRALKAVVKEAVWLTASHKPGHRPDVALFATRRGGSTWLMQVIGSSPGFRTLDQPFSVMTANLTPGHYRKMPKYPYGEIASPSVDEFDALRPYVDALLSGELPLNAPYRFWSGEFRRKTDRQLLKIVGAKSIAPWLDDEFDLDVVLLTRHPITQALSCIRNGWTLTVRAFLDNPRFVDEWLANGLEGRCHDVLATGSDLDRFVLNWGLENMVALGAAPDRSWFVTSYEATVSEPEAVLEQLDSHLDLGGVEPLRRALARPSRSSRLSTGERRAAMEGQDSVALLSRPLESVELADRTKAMSILESMGLTTYAPDSALVTRSR
ncbi:MAG: hypothetical protein GXP35_13790 [Actinobacteria bacterium]|nr:hypothetical protein [Actinomycetota bacterium]